MRQSIRDFVRIASECCDLKEPIYEFGSFQVVSQERISDMRDFFPNKNYIGCDIELGQGVDRIIDIQKMDLPSEIAGTVLCLDTFEHVINVHLAIAEIYRVMTHDAILLLSSHTNFPRHYKNDYWRFTPECFRMLLSKFDHSIVSHAGIEDNPHALVAIAKKSGMIEHDEKFQEQMIAWAKRWKHPKRNLKKIIKNFIPPVLWTPTMRERSF